MTHRLIALLAVSLAACSPPDGALPASAFLSTVTVTRVVDGDTIDVDLSGDTVTVRLIGVDTPETVAPSQPVGCFGREASRFTMKMLDGQEIRLEFDVERTDQYGRTLAYVWLADDMLFNEVLVANGFAQVSTYPPNVKYVDRLVAAQRDARTAGRGLWGRCSTEPDNVAGDGGGECDPHYPDVCCIPPYPPDLDCDDVPYNNFVVRQPDPHGFDDEDADLVGCET